jgi:hypothetical protein
MDKVKFFERLKSPNNKLFGAKLSQPQVEGINYILEACAKYNVTNQHHIAHILAHVYHETGQYMSPIKETVYRSSTNKNPTDATVIKRLNAAWAKGQLSWVKTPYWRDGWFGRGQIQITHKDNYDKLGKKIGVDLVSDPSLALDLKNSAAIAVLGMRDGEFTGKKLSNYGFPQALDAEWKEHPRRIVNGKDGTDAKIKEYHMNFYDALQHAGHKAVVTEQPKPATPVAPKPVVEQPKPTTTTTPTVTKEQNILTAILEIVKKLFGGK